MIAVIGGGHNGMVAALCLAKSGHKVSLFEARPTLGGIISKHAFGEGFFTDGLSHHVENWSPLVSQTLKLDVPISSPSSRYIPEQDGTGLLLHHGAQEATQELQDRGQDALKYAEYREFIQSLRPMVEVVGSTTPPSLSVDTSLFDYVPHALRFRKLGRSKMMEVLRIGAMSAQDWVSEYATDPLLQVALAAPACFTAWIGPRSPLGTANILYDECLKGNQLARGVGALAETLKQALQDAGVDIVTGDAVTKIDVAEGAVTAIHTASGAQHEVSAVLATCSPQRTLLDLVNSRHLPIDLTRNVQNLRSRGTVAVAHFGIKGALRFTGRPDLRVERALIGESTTEWERCFDHAKHRRLAPLPCLDIRVPSETVDQLCPEGHQVISVHAFGAPYDLEGGWTQQTKNQFETNIVDSIERYAPGFSKQIVTSQLLSPKDLETEYGLPGGHLLHVEHAVDQLWLTRPTPDLAQYSTPIAGLYLGSIGMHPGGGVNGLCGLLAAQTLIREVAQQASPNR